MSNVVLDSGSYPGVCKVSTVEVQSKLCPVEDVDAHLVELARQGDKTAYRKLVERYQQRVVSVALGVTGNYQDAEDIAQEAFIKAYRNLPTFRGQSSFYTWLYRIVLNLGIDLSRKAYRRNEQSFEDLTTRNANGSPSNDLPGDIRGATEAPDEQFRRGEMRQHFSDALAQLSPQHRAAIVLREVDGLSYDEISRVAGCSKGTVMSRLHHARKKLQQVLRAYASENDI